MEEKGIGDFVTEVDLATEKRIRRGLREAHPDHGILGEEFPAHQIDAPLVWILDPIDGTSNFGTGLPIFAVSIACFYRGSPVAAAVHCFPEDVTYRAGLGLGAHRGRQRLDFAHGTGRQGRLGPQSMLGLQWHRGPRKLGYLDKVVATGTRIRNLGSTVAQLADVAAGRLDGNVQEQGKIWDYAAAALIVTEAGGLFTDWRGKPIFPLADYDGDRHTGSIAARPVVHRQLVAILGPLAHRTKPS